jgi:hypothetical protein
LDFIQISGNKIRWILFLNQRFKKEKMKVLTRFQSPYDKYLFEGIINPEDYYSFVGTWSGSALNNQILDPETFQVQAKTIVSLYVLNTLDHNIKIEPDNPDNILTKFFSSIQTSKDAGVLTSSEPPLVQKIYY